MSKVFEGQVAELNKGVATALDKAAKSAPAGSDVAVAAVKSAIAAANSAYDSMSKARQAGRRDRQANVAAATNATVKAVSTTAKTTARRLPKLPPAPSDKRPLRAFLRSLDW